MWSAISKIFTKTSADNLINNFNEESNQSKMEYGGNKKEMDETITTKQARQRATIKWLLSKAFNNKVPENLKEPFYRDHENQEHLKPQIVGALANAEIYCLALGNIYSDPNYHNLNHWAILQTLARKGINMNKASESQLTETTLIQTNPLRMNAHMAVIESIMSLYAKEVVTPERVLATIKRFSHDRISTPPLPDTAEKGLLLWISHACEALKSRIEQDLRDKDSRSEKLKTPNIPTIRELKDLCDGVGLAALVSYYCPDELPWTDLKISYIPTVQESLHNVMLLQSFCTNCLPAPIFHMSPEDITYMRDTMKLNLVAFLADLYNLLEIQGASCVKFLTSENISNNVSRSAPAHIGLKKSNPSHHSTSQMSQMSEDSLWKASEDSFVVHRGKNIPTLSSVVSDEPMARMKNNKDRLNNDAKCDDRESWGKAAGKPSNWEESKRPSFSGRRSRRNSISDDSQLTIENFGGSQDNLNFIGRNPDKELTVHVGRKISAPSLPIENPAVRSSLKDARGSIQLGYDDGTEKQDTEPEKFLLKRQLSSDDIALRKIMGSQSSDKENLIRDLVDGEVINRISSFADIKKQSLIESNQKGIHLVYMQHDKEDTSSKKEHHTNGTEKKTSFAELPNKQTTWQQQCSNQQHVESNGKEENGLPNNMTAQINDIRLKLEEKRRHIESEKRRMEVAMNKNRQKIGKAAFLQAVTKDVNEDASMVERKWLTNDQPFIETKRTPELENMDYEQYQQSIAQIDSSLHDIHSDIQRLQTQQNQLQAAQQQNLLLQQQKQLHALQQQYQEMQQPPQYHQQHSFNPQMFQPVPPQTPPVYSSPLQTSSSVPHIPHAMFTQQPQFFLHDQPLQQPNTPPVATPRRTWTQQAHNQSPQSFHINSYNSPASELRTWGKPQNPAGFLLHDSADRYHNGEGRSVQHSNSFTLSQQHLQNQNSSFGTAHSTPSASPQHRSIQKQISQLMDESKRHTSVSLQQMDVIPPQRKISITHAPIPAPSADDMEPQNISFIGNSDDHQINESLSKLNITSGSRTYRIPSPTRPSIAKTSFRPTSPPPTKGNLPTEVSSLNTERDPTSQKGFYISFDNEQPKRPKPPLRTKRGSPKKELSFAESDDGNTVYRGAKRAQFNDESRKNEETNLKIAEIEERKRQQALMREQELARAAREAIQERQNVQVAAEAIIIGNELSNPDPDLNDEREKKKEKIMLLSLQRRQQQEEAKQRKEHEAQIKREAEKAKEELKLRKKEEQAARRAVILEQYKLKKAIEEAEREGKVMDKSEYMSSLKPTPRTRPKAASRPRPKTIHIDSGSVEMAGGMLEPSRGKKGSTSNLTGSTLKRDYYRGSQDSLADKGMTSGLLYRDSPDDSRGMSPCHSANQTLGRRSSYKTSRDPSPAQVRGRSKFSTYQNFKGRKSSSLMNLYGSSTDQDSMAYRYGETDSGLGRATPPRRAPSPGMGSLRHLPSPSGPGSLPGLMSKGRRLFDDGSSDISSTPSSMMDYTGPRLYKQPATKSNRSIMLNAVEYCVFPGVVNREAKRRVLEEINRSESKHFLILFRDAGCQFRALYSYCPDREEVSKLYGTGPKQVNDRMFDKFFKYNSGGKCFSQVHTKHLTVTIDAFTIHNSLWQGKKVNLPNKKDMTLVI